MACAFAALLITASLARGLVGQDPEEFELVLAIPPSPLADEPAFSAPVYARFGPDGRELYVVDNFRRSVRVFQPSGALLREFGGPGQGPGDLMRPLGLEVFPNRVAVSDIGNRRVTIFEHEGRYVAGHRLPDLEPERPLRYPSRTVPVRHDQMVAATIPSMGPTRGFQPNMDEVVGLVDSDGRMVQELDRFPNGWGYTRRRVYPNVTYPPPPAARLPPGAVWTTSGDSLYVLADAYRGVVRWHRIERGRAELLLQRDLGWSPDPLPFDDGDLEEMRRWSADRFRDARPDDIELVLPEFMGRLARGGITVAQDGDVWLRRYVPGLEGVPEDEEPVGHPYILVPVDEASPVQEVTLPHGFILGDVLGELLLGVHLEPEFGVPSVRMYRWTGG